MKKTVISFLASLFLLVSCSTDFELNAPYKTIPIVYGLLDQSQDTQFVKINRSFLGYGNNVNYAAINDCTEFNNVIAVLEEYNELGSMIDQDTLRELMVGSLDPGIFYEDSQKVYFFESLYDTLREENSYHLKVSVPEKNLQFDASTDMIRGSFLYFTSANLLRFRMADTDLATTTDGYGTQSFSWKSVEGGRRYEMVLRLNYTEVYYDSSEKDKYIEWNLGSQTSASLNGNENMSKEIAGVSFFNWVVSQLEGYVNESNVMKRVLKKESVELIITVGNDDLNTYMQVNEPVTGVVTERPIFTNVQNGYGIFASKYRYSLSIPPDNGTMMELCAGQLTSGFKFCCDPTIILPPGEDQVQAIFNITNGLYVGCN